MNARDHVAQARAAKMAEALAIGIDDAFISLLVESFYSAIRRDEMLGPIFIKHVKDWPRHLSRMKDFWASITLESGRFSGNPMQKHIAIGGLDEVHFSRWMMLWDMVLAEIAPSPQAAERFREGARRIGESLLTGIQIDRGGLAAVSGKPDPDWFNSASQPLPQPQTQSGSKRMAGAAPYASTPIFDENSLPDALRGDHRTKKGTWGLLRVLQGQVKLVFLDPPSEHLATPGNPAVIPPQATHRAVPIGAMSMQVEFYHEQPQPFQTEGQDHA